MRRPPNPHPPLLVALVAALALAALAPVAGASVSGDDAEGDVTIMDQDEPEPPRNLSLEVTLVGNETGEAVADLPVEVANRWRPEDGRRGAHDTWDLRTDGNGTVAVDASPGPVRVAVDHPDWMRFRAVFELDRNLSLELPLRPVDEDLATLEGTIRSTDGASLPNASLEVTPLRDCDGKRCPVPDETRATARDTTVNGTEVELRWRSHAHEAHVEADEDGRYEVAVPAGSYRLQARAPQHLGASQEVEVDANGTHEADLELTSIPDDSVVLQGVVRDAETGEPIPGAYVTVENPKWGSHDRVRTGADGAYEVETKPGHLVVEVEAHEGGQVCIMDHDGADDPAREEEAGTAVVDPETPCEPHDGPDQAYLPRTMGLQAQEDEVRNLSVDLEPEPEPRSTIQGWVLDDATGEPIADAVVHLRNEETGDWGKAPVDENGSFSAQVPAGYHTVRVQAPGHLGNATNVDVAQDGTAEVVLRAPAGQPAHERACCHAYPTPEGSGDGDAVHGDDRGADGSHEESAQPTGPSSQATIQGQPGELGPYEASSSGGEEPTRSDAPAPGSAALVAALIGAAALGRRLRGC